jgi:hypothetical protein
MTKDVTLHIMTNANPQWTKVTGSKNNDYYYNYTGGQAASGNNKGNNDFTLKNNPSDPDAKFDVKFPGGSSPNTDYKFQSNAFVLKDQDSDNQLSATNDDDTITITDELKSIGSWNWGAKVQYIGDDESRKDETFQCDPVITNRAASPSVKP